MILRRIIPEISEFHFFRCKRFFLGIRLHALFLSDRRLLVLRAVPFPRLLYHRLFVRRFLIHRFFMFPPFLTAGLRLLFFFLLTNLLIQLFQFLFQFRIFFFRAVKYMAIQKKSHLSVFFLIILLRFFLFFLLSSLLYLRLSFRVGHLLLSRFVFRLLSLLLYFFLQLRNILLLGYSHRLRSGRFHDSLVIGAGLPDLLYIFLRIHHIFLKHHEQTGTCRIRILCTVIVHPGNLVEHHFICLAFLSLLAEGSLRDRGIHIQIADRPATADRVFISGTMHLQRKKT